MLLATGYRSAQTETPQIATIHSNAGTDNNTSHLSVSGPKGFDASLAQGDAKCLLQGQKESTHPLPKGMRSACCRAKRIRRIPCPRGCEVPVAGRNGFDASLAQGDAKCLSYPPKHLPWLFVLENVIKHPWAQTEDTSLAKGDATSRALTFSPITPPAGHLQR